MLFRSQLLADDPWRALVYLEAAMKAGRDEPRIRSLIGAAFQAIPPSVRVPGHRFEGAWMGPDPLAGGFLDDQGGVWRVDGDALTPPAFSGDQGSACGGRLHIQRIEERSVLADATGHPVGSVPAGKSQADGCWGTRVLLGAPVVGWSVYDGDTGERVATYPFHPGGELLGSWVDGDLHIAVAWPEGGVDVLSPGVRLAHIAGPPLNGVRGAVNEAGSLAVAWAQGVAGRQVYDLAAGKLLYEIPRTCGSGRAGWARDDRLVTLDSDCGVRVLDGRTGDVLRTLRPPHRSWTGPRRASDQPGRWCATMIQKVIIAAANEGNPSPIHHRDARWNAGGSGVPVSAAATARSRIRYWRRHAGSQHAPAMAHPTRPPQAKSGMNGHS